MISLKSILLTLILPVLSHADCAKVSHSLAEVEKDKSTLELDFNSDYDAGLKRVSSLMEAIADFSDLKKTDECRAESSERLLRSAIGLAPFDQESELARTLSETLAKDADLKKAYKLTLNKYLEGTPKNLLLWCRAERLRQVVASFDCERERKHGKNKSTCKQPTFSFAVCAHLPEGDD